MNEKQKMLRDLLRESNYGSLEKDERFTILKNKLISSIVNEIKSFSGEHYDDFEGDFNIVIPSKYKTEKSHNVYIEWKTDIWTSYKRDDICSDARLDYITRNDKYLITFRVFQQRGESIKVFKQTLINFFKNDAEPILFHELKHILDDIDELYDDNKYIKPLENEREYYNQDQERHNYLISVISDIKKLKQLDNNLTFEQSVSKSKFYRDVISFLPSTKVNKLKSKLADFWIKTYKD